MTDTAAVRALLRPRNRFSDKSDYGNGALIAGSKGMMGAAALSAKAFMRSGGGKLTAHIPAIGYNVMQVFVPEAMAMVERGTDHILSAGPLDKYDVVGIGPGLGSYPSHKHLLARTFSRFRKPMVIDADALNALARNKELLRRVPPGSVLTPHAREFERLFGKTGSDLERIELALQQAAAYQIVLVVKSAFTLVATPGGAAHFNTTGNPGMATGGTGDVLTGIITGLIGQHYEPEQAAVIGVFLHGLAGDFAAAARSEEALIAGDVIESIGQAYRAIHHQ